MSSGRDRNGCNAMIWVSAQRILENLKKSPDFTIFLAQYKLFPFIFGCRLTYRVHKIVRSLLIATFLGACEYFQIMTPHITYHVVISSAQGQDHDRKQLKMSRLLIHIQSW